MLLIANLPMSRDKLTSYTDIKVAILNHMGLQSSICDKFTIGKKRKHDKDTARKVLLKYKKQRLMTRYGQSTVNSSPDTSYGSDPTKPDISADELK